MTLESVKVPPIDDLLQVVKEFSTTSLVSTAEFNAMVMRCEQAKQELTACLKDENGLRSALQHRQGTIKHLRSEITKMDYLIKEVNKSPYSPQKAYFRADTAH
jgi:hypothetical protein